MKVFCSYDSRYDCFLKQLVEFVLKRYGDGLDVKSVREIELVKIIKEFPSSDGRLVEKGKKILLAERKYKELPCLDIEQIEDDEAFISVVETLYHEMGHATDMANMPLMYAYVFDAEIITFKMFATYLFLEYVAERRTEKLAPREYDVYCSQIASGRWNRYEEFDPDTAFLYVSKLLVYFIIKANVLNKKFYYLEKAQEPLLSEYALALEEALKTVYARLPFDDCEQCIEIEDVLNKYETIFSDKYAP